MTREHPVWSTIKFMTVVIAFTILLWNNAETFDETEIMTIIQITGAGMTAISGKAVWDKFHKEQEK